MSQAYTPGHDLRRRQTEDALLAALKLLDRQFIVGTPAPVMLMKADRISRDLHSLGFRVEALQLCRLVNNLLRNISNSDQNFDRSFLAESLLSLSRFSGDAGDAYGAYAVGDEAMEIYKDLDPNTFLPERALSLSNLSQRLNKMGRKPEALKV